MVGVDEAAVAQFELDGDGFAGIDDAVGGGAAFGVEGEGAGLDHGRAAAEGVGDDEGEVLLEGVVEVGNADGVDVRGGDGDGERAGKTGGEKDAFDVVAGSAAPPGADQRPEKTLPW